MGFQLKSGNKVPSFKMMGSSPLKNRGHDAPNNHVHSKIPGKTNEWTAQQVTTDENGVKRITNSNGTVGDEGSTTTTPGVTTADPGEAIVIPGAEGEGSVPGDTDEGGDKPDEGGDKPKMSNEDWAQFLKDNPGWSADKKTDPVTEIKKDKTETKKPVIETTPDTPDTREDEVIEEGPERNAVTDSIHFGGKQRGRVGKFFDKLKEGRKIKKGLTSTGNARKCEKGDVGCAAQDGNK
tara:strand:- start:40 stop:750 length:711 start_codon:yes stop_codon:yes gene_type:complete